MGILKDIMEDLKDPDTYGAVSALIHRTESAGDIEKLTPYPVTRKELGRRMDEFFSRLSGDHRVQEVKREIGTEQMQKAWAEDLKHIEGWTELADRIPDYRVYALYKNKRSGVCTTPEGIQVKNGASETVKRLYDALRKTCIGVQVKKGKTPLKIAQMLIPEKDTVVLVLNKKS